MECMHPTHAPARRIWTTPSVTSRSSMSPPSPWMYGRMVSRTCSTRSRRPPSCVCTCSAISALLSLCRLRMRRGVITRLSLARVMTRPERMPAPAGRNGVGVADREAFAKRRFRIVDLCPAQVLEAAGVHEHLHAAALEDLVVGAALGIESHTVREPFAPTGLNEQPQVQARLLLGLEQLLQLRRRLIGDGNHSGKPSTCHSRGYATLSQTTGSGIREPGYERTQCWKGIVRHARHAAALVQGDCFGAAPLAMTTWVSDPGSRIPDPISSAMRTTSRTFGSPTRSWISSVVRGCGGSRSASTGHRKPNVSAPAFTN